MIGPSLILSKSARDVCVGFSHVKYANEYAENAWSDRSSGENSSLSLEFFVCEPAVGRELRESRE